MKEARFPKHQVKMKYFLNILSKITFFLHFHILFKIKKLWEGPKQSVITLHGPDSVTVRSLSSCFGDFQPSSLQKHFSSVRVLDFLACSGLSRSVHRFLMMISSGTVRAIAEPSWDSPLWILEVRLGSLSCRRSLPLLISSFFTAGAMSLARIWIHSYLTSQKLDWSTPD